MNISSFDDLLQAATQQDQPQRLLFVFAEVELPEGSSPEESAQFAAGVGGALVPVMCVDKAAHALSSFADLKREAQQFGAVWQMVFVAALSGKAGQVPNSEDCEQPLKHMVESIKLGHLDHMIPFDSQGAAVMLE